MQFLRGSLHPALRPGAGEPRKGPGPGHDTGARTEGANRGQGGEPAAGRALEATRPEVSGLHSAARSCPGPEICARFLLPVGPGRGWMGSPGCHTTWVAMPPGGHTSLAGESSSAGRSGWSPASTWAQSRVCGAPAAPPSPPVQEGLCPAETPRLGHRVLEPGRCRGSEVLFVTPPNPPTPGLLCRRRRLNRQRADSWRASSGRQTRGVLEAVPSPTLRDFLLSPVSCLASVLPILPSAAP